MKKTKLRNLIEEEVKKIFEDLGSISEQSNLSPFANYPQAIQKLSAELKNLSEVCLRADQIIAEYELDAVTDRALNTGGNKEEEVDNPSQTTGSGVQDPDDEDAPLQEQEQADWDDMPTGPEQRKEQLREFFYQAGDLTTSMAKIIKSFNTFAVNFEFLGSKSGRKRLIETDPLTAQPKMSPEGMRATRYDPQGDAGNTLRFQR